MRSISPSKVMLGSGMVLCIEKWLAVAIFLRVAVLK